MTPDLRELLQAALGPAFPIERELEGGGMSRVFLARDTVLRRDIVVKLLHPDLDTGVSIERFEREIHLAATLQHPLIVPLLAAGSVAGLPYYTMPFIRGESLRALLTRTSAVPVHEAIHILRDIASALAHAHREGVVHRDIKPENVLLTGGVAVVADFGVAKAIDVAAHEPGMPHAGLTVGGMALGTPSYMSPEQASADPALDHRSDIYSFGCLAFEMLQGAPPFGTRAPQQLLAAQVLERPPSVTTPTGAIPPALAELVMKCLEKAPASRPQSAEEVIAALDALATPSLGTTAIAVRPGGLRIGSALLVGALATGILALAIWRPWSAGESVAAVISTRPVTTGPELEIDGVISPDGKLAAYAAGPPGTSRIYVQQLEGGAPVLLSSAIPGEHRWPQWSPDGSQILFAALGTDSSAVYSVPYTGGAARRIGSAQGRAQHTTPIWSPDGTAVVFSHPGGGSLVTQPVEGGDPRPLVTATDVHSPAFSPDGRRLSYVTGNPPGSVTMFNVAASAVWVTNLPAGVPVRVSDSTHGNWNPVWSPDGQSILYISDRDGTRDIYQQRLSRRGAPAGAPARVSTGLGAYSFSLSRDGTRAIYSITRVRSQIWMSEAGAGPRAQQVLITRDAQSIEGLDLSPDGRWLVYDSDLAGNQEIYKLLIDGGQPIRLTTNPAPDFVPQWSPDGREIVYYSMRSGNRDVRVMDADGRDDQAVTTTPAQESYPTWSADGRSIAFAVRDSAIVGHLQIYTRAGARAWTAERRLLSRSTPCGSCPNFPRWSRTGRWIGYVEDQTVRLISPAGGEPRVLVQRGQMPGVVRYLAWGPDSAAVYVVLHSVDAWSFWRVPLAAGPARRLLVLSDPARQPRRPEFATDGRRLFYTLAADESDLWVMELKP